MRSETLEEIFTELTTVFDDLKAETLIAEIQENSDAVEDDFIIANQGTFSRSYRRDVIEVDPLTHDDRLTLNLSRNGLYDTLPEGLFHRAHTDTAGRSYLAQRKTAKEEEKNTRSLFAPLEQEFFHQKLQIERHERAMLDAFYGLKGDFLMRFWNIDKDIPQRYKRKLVQLLPHAHQIAGDLELTRLCLERLLDEKVSFKTKQYSRNATATQTTERPEQADFVLGVNSILDGDTFAVVSPLLEVNIGPVSQSKVDTYLGKQGILKFLERYYDYFLPMEIEAETKISVAKEVGFVLNEIKDPVMGISTYL